MSSEGRLNLPTHMISFAHSLQLQFKDDMKECSGHLKNRKIMKPCVFVKKSIHANEILENYNCIQKSIISRWNSELRMLQSILKLPEDKPNEIGCKTKLGPYERKLLSELCAILDPL